MLTDLLIVLALVLLNGVFAMSEIAIVSCRAVSVLGGASYRLNRCVNIAGEIFWIPTNTASGRVRTLHVDAVAQFRP